MYPPRIFNTVLERVTIRFDGHYPNRVLQLEFEFLANAAMILGDMYFLADLEARLYHEASRGRRLYFITTQDSSISPARLLAGLYRSKLIAYLN